MTTPETLSQLLDHSAECCPDNTAVVEPGVGKITFRELAVLSNGVRDRLGRLGVCPGDRVGIYIRKSIDAIAALFGVLKAGAAYVPVDPFAPAARNADILEDCSVRVIIVENRFVKALCAEFDRIGELPLLFILEGMSGGVSLRRALESAQVQDPAPTAEVALSSPEDLAYILYTSGSSGRPKGVMLSHQNAIHFIDWCSETFEPNESDRFSSHAPFHFDLSILDIYVPIKHGASLILVGEEVGKNPLQLASLISEEQITSWYSTPSILSLLAHHGKLEKYDYNALHRVIFAGEVFPIKHLRELKRLLPNPRFYNLYGPTETNVCTFYEIPANIPDERTQPFPIGKACSHYRIKVVNEQGQEVFSGQEGELCASGPGVMLGYWNARQRTAAAFLNDSSGRRWYKTGDIVLQHADGDYDYLGRRDRMVKKRGYRVELGEIEASLYCHPTVKEAAVVALMDEADGVRIRAFLSCRLGKRPSLIELKRFCAEKLPSYMIPDLFSFLEALPKTSTDKIDYQKLATLG